MLNKKKTERHLTCKYETLRGILIFTYHYITGWFHKGKDLQTDLKWNLNCMLGVAAWDTIRALRQPSSASRCRNGEAIQLKQRNVVCKWLQMLKRLTAQSELDQQKKTDNGKRWADFKLLLKCVARDALLSANVPAAPRDHTTGRVLPQTQGPQWNGLKRQTPGWWFLRTLCRCPFLCPSSSRAPWRHVSGSPVNRKGKEKH